VVRHPDDEPTAPLQRWIDDFGAVLGDREAARRRAAGLREALLEALRTLQSAGESFADLVKATNAVRNSEER
jgi:hypothetical protein